MNDIDKNYPRADEDINWDNVVWASLVDKEMIAHLDQETQDELIRELDKAVALVCNDFDID